MYYIVKMDSGNKNIVVLDTDTNKKKVYKDTTELRELYNKHKNDCVNFLYDARGFRYLNKKTAPNSLNKPVSSSDNTIDLKDIKLELKKIHQDIMKIGNNQKQGFLTADKVQDRELRKVLEKVEEVNALVTKAVELDKKIAEIKDMLEHHFNDVRQEIADLGMSVVEFQKKFNDISLELLKNTSTDNEFPTVKGTEHLKYYLSEDLISMEPDDYAKFFAKDNFLPVDFNKDMEFLSVFSEHLKLINDARISIEKEFVTDAETNKNQIDEEKWRISKIGIEATIMGSAIGFSVVTLKNLLTTLTSGIFILVGQQFSKDLKGFVVKDVDRYRNTVYKHSVSNPVMQHKRVNYDFTDLLNKEEDQVPYPRLLKLDKDTNLLSNYDVYTKYIAELRNFMIVLLSCQYKKSYITILKDIKISGRKELTKKSKKVLMGSLFNNESIADSVLFDFYCEYYYYDAIFPSNKTQTEINNAKCLADCFVNAYFASRMLYLEWRVRLGENKMTDLSTVNTLYLKKFLKTLKQGLILQGINLATANNLIQEFLKIGGINLHD